MRNFNSLTACFLIIGGIKIFPCHEGGPAAKAPYTRRGFKEASADSAKLETWRLMFPNAVWGLPCAVNGVLVLDADQHGKGDGVDNIMRLFKEHRFDSREVPIVKTPRSGLHFYFRRPEWLGRTKATLCDAVDVRDNAYVIAPECTMRDGGQYKLVEGNLVQFAEFVSSRRLIEPPEWLVAMLVHPSAPAPKEIAEPVDDDTLLNQIKGIIGAVLQAEVGNRNMLLFWAACRLAEMVKADRLIKEWVEEVLEETGARLGLPARETRATIASGLRKGWEDDHDAR